MTQTLMNKQVIPETVPSLLEKLEALPRFNIFKLGTSAAMVEQSNGKYVNIDDLRAIIEQAKAEKQEALYCDCGDIINDANKMPCANCHAASHKQPDIVAELVKALEDIIYSAKYFPSNAKRLGDIAESAIARAKAMTE